MINDAYDSNSEEYRTVTISLAEYRELLRTSTLYRLEHRDDPRPLKLDTIEGVE